MNKYFPLISSYQFASTKSLLFWFDSAPAFNCPMERSWPGSCKCPVIVFPRGLPLGCLPHQHSRPQDDAIWGSVTSAHLCSLFQPLLHPSMELASSPPQPRSLPSFLPPSFFLVPSSFSSASQPTHKQGTCIDCIIFNVLTGETGFYPLSFSVMVNRINDLIAKNPPTTCMGFKRSFSIK